VGKFLPQVAEKADITFSMVTNTNAVLAVTGGPDGVLAGLKPGKIYIDMSTISPAVSRDLAKQVAAKGAVMLDSPVSGSVETLEAGKLTLMVGGYEATFEKVKPILLDIGPKATHVGENGLAVTVITNPESWSSDAGLL
jgi:3-hydroxyisobutyrate dehydrogenase-like beta-hydroxyacid dehydrogenase